jgi:hypothetical protein
MVNLVETLIGICIASLLIAGLAWVQSRSGGEREAKYRTRMRRFLILAAITGIAGAVGEILLRI